jgi:hypothetical protein
MTMEHACEQYSEEWTRLRLGIPTASRFDDVITPAGKPTAGRERRKYLFRLIAERLLGQTMDDGFESVWMRRGSELEQQALAAFIAMRNVGGLIDTDSRKAGFFTALEDRVGASPDYILGENAGLEIKCPAPYTMVEYLVDGPGDRYKAQVQGQMLVCNWEAMHFWAWHPLMPPAYIMTRRDDTYVYKLETALREFCAELDDVEAYARGKGLFRLAEKLRLSDELQAGGAVMP